MDSSDAATQGLPAGVAALVAAATQEQQERKHALLGVHHWLFALLRSRGAMAEALAQNLEARSLREHLREQLRQGAVGEALAVEAVVRHANERARGRGVPQPTERDLAAVILGAAGYPLVEAASSIPSSVSQGASVATAGEVPVAAATGTAGYNSRARRPTPTLEQFGRDLTRAAVEGKLSPVVGRGAELELVIETLCRRTKRNPALVGPAGVGKTAIVEGLAQRIVRGEVPEILRGARLIELQPSSLVAGAHVVGELEKRMKALLAEASQDGLLLFIDEVHSVVGAGGMPGSGDIASLLKPALARGDLACIGATTDDEYRRFIQPDGALERRFQPIRVDELSADQTLVVLRALRDNLGSLRTVRVEDDVLSWLVDFGARFLRNRYFPDKAVDLLEQCVAYAVTRGAPVVELGDAQAVARRLIGMPVAAGEGRSALATRLSESGLLAEKEASALLSRLSVSLQGLDARPSRPNAVVLLWGEAAAQSEALADTIAESLFGSAQRVVTIDFGRFTHPADASMLLGAPPGYVGYSDTLVLHRVTETPWCVLRCENVDVCHPELRQLLTAALTNGYLTDARSKRIYLSDTVVLLTARNVAGKRRSLGFGKAGEAPPDDVRRAAEEALGAGMVAEVDLVSTTAPSAEAELRQRLKQVLADLVDRYRKQGVDVQWKDSLFDWLATHARGESGQAGWERLIDEQLSPVLIQHLPWASAKEVRSITLTYEGGTVRIERQQPERGGD